MTLRPDPTTDDAPAAEPAFRTLRAFYRTVSPRRRRQLRLVVAVMLLGALAEMVTIGAVLPFLALLADPARAHELPGFRLFLATAGAGEGGDLIVRATALLIAAVVTSAAVRLLVVRLTYRFVFALGHEIGIDHLRADAAPALQPLCQPQSRHVIAGVDKVQLVIQSVLLPVTQGIAASVIALAIIVALIVIAPAAAALAAVAATLALSRRKLCGGGPAAREQRGDRRPGIGAGAGGSGGAGRPARHPARSFARRYSKRSSGCSTAPIATPRPRSPW